MIQIYKIIGHLHDSEITNKIHNLSHQGKVEYIELDHDNLRRKRFRAKTDKGTDCAVTISRNQELSNGSVILLEDDRAIVIKMTVDEWLSLKPIDITAAIELGYFAGNMHWRVKFEKECLYIALESPEEVYLDRLKDLFNQNKITRITNE